MSLLPKNGAFIQICIAVIGLVIAAAVVGLWNEMVSNHNTLIVHTIALESLEKSMVEVADKLKEVPSRSELDYKISLLRNNVDLDNKAVQKGTKGAEMLTR